MGDTLLFLCVFPAAATR